MYGRILAQLEQTDRKLRLSQRLAATQGDATSALEGQFRVEMHDSYELPVKEKYDTKSDSTANVRSLVVTLTSFAHLRTVGQGGGTLWCPDPESAPSTSAHAVRTQITLQHIPK